MIFAGCITLPCLGVAQTEPTKTLSTSGLVPVGVQKEDVCKQSAKYGEMYVNLTVTGITVNKQGCVLCFREKGYVYAVGFATGSSNGQSVRISRVGDNIAMRRAELNSVDLVSNWKLFSGVPWLLKSPRLDLRVNYADDGQVGEIAGALKAVTAAVPDFTISKSIAVGLAVGGVVEDLLLKDARSTSLLRLPVDLGQDGRLCAGTFAVFAADNKGNYEKYEREFSSLKVSGATEVSGGTLLYNNEAIKDSNYALIRVSLSPTFYTSPAAALNDLNRPWNSKLGEVIYEISQLLYSAGDAALVKSAREKIVGKIAEMWTLLREDADLLYSEKQGIYQNVQKQLSDALVEATSKLPANGVVSQANQSSAQAAVARNFSNILSADQTSKIDALRSKSAPAMDSSALRAAVQSIQTAIK
jgi:hypothetical protein